MEMQQVCKLKPMVVNSSLPDDLVPTILSRLPVRDLLRFRCVCKDWCALIGNPTFIRNHYQVQYSISKLDGSIPHFVDNLRFRSNGDFSLLYIHQYHVSTVDLNANLERDCFSILPLSRDQCSVSIYGCVNGVILLKFSFKKRCKHNCLGLWNPSTRKFKVVDYPLNPTRISSPFSVNGFGFDMISNDLKILGTYRIASEGKYYHEIYSLRTNTWKRLSLPPVTTLPFSGTDAFLNGVQYWYGFPKHETEIDTVIVTFNYSSESYKLSDLPDDDKFLSTHVSEITITLYQESIGLFISQRVQELSLLLRKIDVWVATGFDQGGVPLSWQHLFTVEPTPNKMYREVSTTRTDGKFLIRCMELDTRNFIEGNEITSEEYLYNPSTAKLSYFRDGYSYYYRYIESLFPLLS